MTSTGGDREDGSTGKARTGGVQSIERAFAILEALAGQDGGVGLSALAADSGLPLPTIHRLTRTLVDLGYVRQEASRRYSLGPKVLLLAENATGMLGSLARLHLAALVDELGETANLASLDAGRIVYVAQVPSRHSVRMFTEVGRQVLPHCTAVGKAIMARMPRADVREILRRNGMPGYTENTLTDPDAFDAALDWAAQHGYAVDEGEQEVGVRCVAVAVPGAPGRLAVSVSGPAGRMTPELIERAVPLLAAAGAALAAELS
ncbi:IclR family transcriptional regulator [Nakamurella flavida]|uniref:Glycerol operon regulatory protein n=1 Tax=Nakamurella flavida TaxID=363630 RepID=A0A939C3N3_9ACTN|nr:IclR family transcriptional regulator [Nakamurella flavida]MBM9477855.1 IclR family transcriptional regulator [Nakamurella flavida]MDP9779410.1 IclR family acetate operon transcriptional repressor [Nakamurella flavida]